MFEQDITGCFSPAGEINRAAVDTVAAQLPAVIDKYAALRGTGKLALLDQPSRTDDLKDIKAAAERIRAGFQTLIVLGIGGSSLGGQMLVELKQSLFRAAPQVIFLDNIDPHTFDDLCKNLDLKKSFFLSISKSGGTAETLAQTLTVVAALKNTSPDAPAQQMLVIAEPGNNPLRDIAAHHKIPTLDHPVTLGGRFSVLSAVGLLPAAVAGLNIERVRRGAAAILNETLKAGATGSAAAQGAALQMAMMNAGKRVNVIMPYSDRLRLFGAWYKQIWAESLGKQGKGSTAIRAVGAVDQHSQLQLFLDGPNDKLVTLILQDQTGRGNKIPVPEQNKPLDYLRGRTMGDLMDAEQRATAATLLRSHRPVRILRIMPLDEEVLGALIMHFMLETIFVAELMGINAFDQPAVEEGKCLAREYLAKM